MVLRLHYNLEKLSMGLVGAIIVAASIGGLVEIAPVALPLNPVHVALGSVCCP